jgi:CBS domain containing-hemolysin-like protein
MAPWIITLLIIFANGFFVAAEFAIVKVRSSQIDVLIKQWNIKGKLMKHIIEHLDDYLSACQLGITLTSLTLWWVAEPLIATQLMSLNTIFHRWFTESLAHAIAIPITFFIITVLHIVLGELAPKTMAIRDPLAISKICVTPLHRFYIIFKPFIRLLNNLSLWLLRLFGVTWVTEEESHSEEELRMIVAESEEDGQINASERELIHNVFDFDNKDVSEIMTPVHKIFAISASKWDEELIASIFAEWYSRVPVYQESINNIIGRVLVKDIVTKIMQKKEILLHELMRPIHYVPENQKIVDCLRELQRQHMHLAMVTSEHGTTIGLITMEDIIEELVGDIHDEGDDHSESLVKKVDNAYIIDASGSLAEVNDFLPTPLPESDEYDTISGMINNLFGRIPSLGEVYTTEHYTITITKRKKQRVEQIKLESIDDSI